MELKRLAFAMYWFPGRREMVGMVGSASVLLYRMDEAERTLRIYPSQKDEQR
jgi:hypothetical protein